VEDVTDLHEEQCYVVDQYVKIDSFYEFVEREVDRQFFYVPQRVV
jgi:hypothetical protein